MSLFMENACVEAVLGLAVLAFIIYRLWTSNYTYWKDRNIPYIEPKFPFGNTGDFILQKRFIGDVTKDMYFQLEGHKFGGFITLRKPGLIVKDPEIIKLMLTKDFHHFNDRAVALVDEKRDPLSAHLFNLAGDKWKILRTKLTPTFTSGKMKLMFHLMSTCASALQKSLSEYAERGDVIELKDYMARYGTDVIGSCAFGLEIDSINNPDNAFRKISKDIFTTNFFVIFINMMNSFIPGLSKFLKVKATPKEREDFFFKIVGDTVEYREKNNIKRNDFLDLLIQIKNKGHVEDDVTHSNESHLTNDVHKTFDKANPTNDIELTNELMTAQCFVFFIAGFETSSTTLSFCIYELALNKDIHNKLQEEIDRVLEKHSGQITYEALKDMTYMDTVVQVASDYQPVVEAKLGPKFKKQHNSRTPEAIAIKFSTKTLRKYPPLATITRECTSDYKLPDSHLTIEKGTRISVPLYGLHYDPKYYPEPERFLPDRFTEEAKQSRPHYTWMPFGEGPRICIGMRFGLLQVKTGLAALLSKYNFDRVPETQVPMEFCGSSFTVSPKNGIQLKITKRTN